jgi:two-component system, LytTR family, response regulator
MTLLASTNIRERRPPQARERATVSKRSKAFFFIRHQGRNLKIRVLDIDYIESRKNYCKIATKNGAFMTIVTLKHMATILPPDQFCRIHRAFIVSLEWIVSFDRSVVYGADHTLPIGDVYRHEIIKRVVQIGDELRKDREMPA